MDTKLQNLIARSVYWREKCHPRTVFHRRQRPAEPPRKILVGCMDAVGDLVLMSPFFRELRRSFPKAQITLITSSLAYNLMEKCPYLDELLIFDKKFPKHKFMRQLRESRALGRRLAERNYDLYLAPSYANPDFYAESWIGFFAGIPRRVCFSETVDDYKHCDYQGTQDLFFTDCIRDAGLHHAAEAGPAMLRYLGKTPESDAIEVWTDDGDARTVERLFAEKGIPSNRIHIAVSMTTSNRTKDWPVEDYLAACKALESSGPVDFLLVGAGRHAEEDRDAFLREKSEGVYSFVGETTLRQSVEVFRRSDAYLGGDTGTLHLAAACKLPGVAIYKSAKGAVGTEGDPSAWFAPWQSDIHVLQPDHALPGCEQGCMKDRHCIRLVRPEQVITAMQPVLEQCRRRKERNETCDKA